MFFRAKEASASDEGGSRKRLMLMAVMALAGILLLIFGGRIGQNETAKEAEEGTDLSAMEELEVYQTYLEERVRTLCLSVKGVENVTVAVTLNGNFEEVYATEMKDGNEEYVIVGSGSNASALHLSRTAPEIAGIGVVCCGGGNTDVRRELISLLSAAFRVPANRIYVTEAKF